MNNDHRTPTDMQAIPVIAIFDVGKTNKKLFLFDEAYRMVYEESQPFPEIQDEDGDPCENLELLTCWIKDSCEKLMQMDAYEIRAINFSAYGASFVHIDEGCDPIAPLYNYLKAFPKELQQQLYDTYGGEKQFAIQTASPALGMLNSGLQLYWLKYYKPDLFDRISCSLHLPQYLSFLITRRKYSDLTSLGCHTGLWDFGTNDYHEWVCNEGIHRKLAPVYKSSEAIALYSSDRVISERNIMVGVGLHDSSAALIPYLATFQEPFLLLSTGTWCITLNPFNTAPLNADELDKDCLCYLSYEGKSVKASRLFAGYEHEIQIKRIAEYFGTDQEFYKTIEFDPVLLEQLVKDTNGERLNKNDFKGGTQPSLFGLRSLALFKSAELAYYRLLMDLVEQQVTSTELVMQEFRVTRLFVDGGFGKNPIYMNLLGMAFPELKIYAASLANATALGAALAIHQHWNNKAMPANLIELKCYSPVNAG